MAKPVVSSTTSPIDPPVTTISLTSLNLPGADGLTDVEFLAAVYSDPVLKSLHKKGLLSFDQGTQKVAIYGTNGTDVINGSALSDTIYAGNSGDKIYAGAGNDVVVGGNGKDIITGGLGGDTLTGGNAADIFVYKSITESPVTAATPFLWNGNVADFIPDFTHGLDKLDFTNLSAHPLNFTGTTATNYGVWYQGGTGGDVGYIFVYADTNGDGNADLVIKMKGPVSGEDIIGLNHGPTIDSNGGGDAATVGVGENSTAVATVHATDPDAGATLTYSIVGGADQAKFSIDSSTGALSFVSAPNFEAPTDADTNNSYVVQVQVSDGLGGIDTQAITVNVTDVNETPNGGADIVTSTPEDTNETAVIATVVATDPDVGGGNDLLNNFENLNYSILTDASGKFEIDGTTGQITLATGATLDYETATSHTITVRVTDGGGLFDDVQVTIGVTNVNEAPVAVDDTASTDEDTALNGIDVLGNDTDVEGDTLSISGTPTALHGTVTVNGDGTLNYTPTANYNGPDTITYTVTDGTASDTGEVAVTVNPVNDMPVAVDDTASTDEDTALNGIDVLGNDTDVEGDTLSISGTPTALHGTVTVNGDGTLNYTPTANYNGPDTITYTVTDGTASDTGEVAVTVNPVNDMPVAVDDTASTDEDTALNGIDVLGNDTDVEGDTLSISGTPTALHGTVTVNGDGTLNYTPTANYNGPDTITYTVTDGTASDTGEVAVTVNPVNDMPVAVDDTASTDEDTALNGIDVLGNDTDVEGDTLSISGTPTALHGTVTVNGDGTLNYTPTANYNGPDTITYTVTDGTASDTGEVAVTVNPVNDMPVAVDDTASTDEDTALNGIDVLGNDTDVEGDTLSISGTPTALHGTVTVNGDGTLNYTPTANYNGPDTITYTVTDGTASDTGEVAVTVNPVNDMPVAVDDTASTDEDTALNGIDVLGNDTDVEGDTLSISGTPTALHGTVTVNGDGTLNYTPTANYNGPDTITYTVTDGTASDTGEVAVTVNPVNDMPVAVDDTASTDEDTALNGIDVLGNDTDVEGDTLSISGTPTALHGTVTVNGDGTLNYTPTANYNGPDTITYTVTDGTASDTGEVAVTVNPVNDMPVIDSNGGGTTAAISIPENTTAVTTVHATDVDGDSITYSIVPGNEGSSFSINETTGVLVLNSAPDFESPTDAPPTNSYIVTVQASDGHGGTDTQTITVNVTDVGEAPPDILGPNGINFVLSPAGVGASNDNGQQLNAGVLIGNFVATGDPNSTVFHYQLGGTDAGLFSLNTTTGALSVGGSSINQQDTTPYDLTIQAFDQANNPSPIVTLNVYVAGTGADTIIGIGNNIDIAYGQNGADTLTGGDGADALIGGQNNDTINGGGGADQLVGGQGNDEFVYAATSDSPGGLLGFDTIFDFEEVGNSDVINLQAIDANTGSGGNQAFAFVAAQTASVVANSVTWSQDGTNTTVRADVDGNVANGAEMMFVLTGLNSLTSGDFTL